jgi:diguanylate cyclase (GGDEF)-like protein
MKALGAEHELTFWLRHVRIGVSISQLTLVVCLAYTVLFAAPPRRPFMVGLIVFAFAVTLGVGFLPLRRMLAGRWAILFFTAWSALLTLLIVAGSIADGGGDTPLAFLFFLPVVYGAIAYPPAGVWTLGVLVISTAVVTHALGGGEPGTALLLGGTLTAVTTMCAVTAQNHWRTHRSQAALAQRLQHLARHDGLTGCLNHGAFHDLLQAESERALRYGRPLALLVVDLDGFKDTNDTHGHPCGDAVLAEVGRVLRETTRESDRVGRIGGDEFGVLLPETGLDEAALLAERARAAVGELAHPVPISASIGVSAMPESRDAAALLAAADEAVYRAKRSGRDFVSVSGTPSPDPAVAGGPLGVRIRGLMTTGVLVTVFQPVVSLVDGSVLGYEALSRISGSSLGPAQWLDLAEQVGMREALEAAMWRTALAAGHPPEGTILFLNASPGALLSGSLSACRDDLPPGTAIEVSEHHAIGDYAVLTRDLAGWVDAGCRIAVDDMGAGNANLAHVLNLAPHYLKLDRSLVMGLDQHPSRIALVESLITFASRIGSRIIAEGIETEAEALALWQAGVRFGQGHLFGHPAPPWSRVDWRPPLIDPLARQATV